jgi:hypothetical protein
MVSLPAIERLPPEILRRILSRLDRKDLIGCLSTCKSWNNLLTTDLTVWPSNIYITQDPIFIYIEQIACHNQDQASNACQWLSNLPGVIKSLTVELPFYREDLNQFFGFDFSSWLFSLENLYVKFRWILSLQKLHLDLADIWAEDILYILENVSSLRYLKLIADEVFGDQNIVLFNPTILIDLYISMPESQVLASSLISQSPELMNLTLLRIDIGVVPTGCFSHKLQFLSTILHGNLPELCCRNLTALHLLVKDIISNDGQQQGDLSNVKYLDIDCNDDITKVMRFYSIGVNVVCLKVEMRGIVQNIVDVCRLTPNLKVLMISGNLPDAMEIDRLLAICHVLRIVCCGDKQISNRAKEILHARDVTVTNIGSQIYQETCTFCGEFHNSVLMPTLGSDRTL